MNQPVDRVKVDYKNQLDEATFKVFSKLREIRKKLAAEEAIPAYSICTDQELAVMAGLKQLTKDGLLTVKGFCEKKMEEYGLRILEMYHENIQHETDRQSL